MITKTVLLVGTDDRLLRQMRGLLESRRIDTFEAPDPETADELVRKRPFDLALVDGAALTVAADAADKPGRASSRWPEVPSYVLIESGDPEAERRALQSGFDGYIAKPIQTRTFLIAVHRQLVRSEGLRRDRNSGSAKQRILMAGVSEGLTASAAVLRDHGYEVLTVEEGASAAESAVRQRPDLVLIDWASGGDNLAALTALKIEPGSASVPVLMLIGLDDQDGRTAGLEAGAEEFLSKPVRTVELLSRVRTVLERRAAGRRPSEANVHLADGGTEVDAPPETRPVNGDHPVILLVDPHEREARSLQAALRDLPVRIEVVQSGEKALLYAQSKRVDAVLLDVLLPDLDGLEVCRRLKEHAGESDLPIVVTTCLDEKAVRVRCKALGVDDYFVKPVFAAELRARIETLLERKSRADRRERLCRTALDAAIIDWLTGLYAPGYFRTALALECRRSERHGYPVSILLLDVDDFRLYNDLLGPKAGDLLLQELAHLVRSTVREVDLAARNVDDEFAVILPDCDRSGAFQVARRIHAAVENRRFFHDAYAGIAGITLSMGIAVFPADAPAAGELIRKAGQMLLRAKRKGKDRICL